MKDISEILNFKRPDTREGPKRVRYTDIVNKPVTVLQWEKKPSKFEDDNKLGCFMHIVGRCNDTNDEWQTNTASNVVIEQFEKIDNAGDKSPFTCIFRKSKYLKMYPAVGTQPGE